MRAVNALIAYTPAQSALAQSLAETLPPGMEAVLSEGQGLGAAIREGIGRLQQPFTLLLLPGARPSAADIDAMCAPLENDSADAVYAYASDSPLGFSLSELARWVTDAPLTQPFRGAIAFKTDVLKSLPLRAEEEDIFPEILVKAKGHMFRLTEVEVSANSLTDVGLGKRLKMARALLHFATHPAEAEGVHEGYTTLAHLEGGAPNYNAWLGQRFREYCGKRVLEIGAGIGTITAQLEAGREKVIALEVEDFYIERLRNRFRGKPHIVPYKSDVALADWESLRQENVDSIVLSNVLEHIPDDAGALQRFRQILPPGGHLLILVPALPALFGSMDEAVGHHRRYTREGLQELLQANGFSVEKLEWMNIVGIPGWFLNGRLFKRRALPPLQLRAYDLLAPLLAKAEATLSLPVGMSLFAVARATTPA